jgi:hypothetical protein
VFSAGDPAEAWKAWQGHLAGGSRPLPLEAIISTCRGGLDWALPALLAAAAGPDWLDEALGAPGPDAGIEKRLLEWLAGSAGATTDHYALRALACCHALPELADSLSADVWWTLLDRLVSEAADAADAADPEKLARRDPLAWQLLGGELPLALAYLFPEINPCRKLKSPARRVLSTGLVELLDSQGLPAARHSPLFRPLLACWTRCQVIGDRLKRGCLSDRARDQYRRLVRQALRLCRPDGSHAFSRGPSGAYPTDLFRTALRFVEDPDDAEIAALALPRSKKRRRRPPSESGLPGPGYESEWSAAAVLRRAWAGAAERLVVLHDEPQVRVEFCSAKDVLWSGQWQLDIRLDGRPVALSGEWESICWHSDDDVDYLELEMELGELRVQRQMLLARDDGFLLLADAILGVKPGTIDYRSCLPLAPGVEFRPATESREGLLVGTKRRARVMPLALPEWRAERRVGELARTSEGLELRQTHPHRLYAPLLFDFDRRRRRKRLTWRQLTVAESLRVVPPETAVGYRVAVGKQQWLVYRSLGPKANRTLLGHNLSTEMLVAQFDRWGEVEPLLEIE